MTVFVGNCLEIENFVTELFFKFAPRDLIYRILIKSVKIHQFMSTGCDWSVYEKFLRKIEGGSGIPRGSFNLPLEFFKHVLNRGAQ